MKKHEPFSIVPGFRTHSARWWAGSRANKPLRRWTKKQKRNSIPIPEYIQMMNARRPLC